MKMSKHSIIYHKHSTFLVLMSPTTHFCIRKVHECMCGLWYRHACDMADDNQPNENPFNLPSTPNVSTTFLHIATDNQINESD